MKKFEVTGTFIENHAEKKFTKEISAENQNRAMDKALSMLGSAHKVKRNHIKVTETKEIKE